MNKPPSPIKIVGFWVMYVASLILAVLIVYFLTSCAQARDDGRYAQSPLKPWFDSLRSERGPCCSDADGTALSDVDWESIGGSHFRVRIMEEWFEVPDEAVLKVPNRVGKTMVWPVYKDGRVDYIRCFIPGTMS